MAHIAKYKATSVRSHSPDLRSTDTFHFMASPSKPS